MEAHLVNGSMDAMHSTMQNDNDVMAHVTTTFHGDYVDSVNGNCGHDNQHSDFVVTDALTRQRKSRVLPRSLSLTNACSRREQVEHASSSVTGSPASRSCVSTPDGVGGWMLGGPSRTYSFQDTCYDDEGFVHINAWYDRYNTNPFSRTEVIYLHAYRYILPSGRRNSLWADESRLFVP